MAPMAVMSPKPAARTSKKKPAKSQQSQCLPIRYVMQSKSRRHDPVPQVQNRLTEAEHYDRSDDQRNHQHLNHSLGPHFIPPYRIPGKPLANVASDTGLHIACVKEAC